jgi:hypothetical protein
VETERLAALEWLERPIPAVAVVVEAKLIQIFMQAAPAAPVSSSSSTHWVLLRS